MGSDPLEEAGQAALKVRAFFGLPVPEGVREELEPYLVACAAIAPEFRWVPVQNLHVTIRFIGNVERDLVEDIVTPLAGRPLKAFELAVGGLGTFRRGRLVRVISLQVSS